MTTGNIMNSYGKGTVKLANDALIAEFTDPLVIGQAVKSCFGEVLADRNQDSPELYEARSFLAAHHRRGVRRGTEMEPPKDSFPSLSFGLQYWL